MTFNLCFAQQWKAEDYQKCSIDNFRSNKLFLQKVDAIDYSVASGCLFYAVNELRVKNRMLFVKYLNNLEATAWHHAKSMAELYFQDHINENDDTRRTPDDRARLAGIRNATIGECIYVCSSKGKTYLSMADDIVKGWMESPWHKVVIMHYNNLQLGCGVYDSKNGYYNIKAVICFQQYDEAVIDTAGIIDTIEY
ncbi:MAG: CAP domain-containing protein [Bacteroidota bacterium]